MIQRFLGDLFIRQGLEWFGAGMVTVSQVRMSPDLRLARVYLSAFNTGQEKEAFLNQVKSNRLAIKNELAKLIRSKVRSMPDLEFYLDDTLDEVMKLEKLFDDLKKDAVDDPKISEGDYTEEV